jgi:hypothetical protein
MAVLSGAIAGAQGQYSSGSVGVDIGWPNCNVASSKVAFGIVGVNNGTGYSTNPCVASEASRFTNLSLYANTGWNAQSSFINPSSPRTCDAGDNNCLAYNYGYNAGVYALSAASSVGVVSSTWWLDVENVNTWSSDTIQNRNSLQGEYDALTAGGVSTVGAYSTTTQWNSITGSWQNYWPNWGATTWTTATQAKKYCTGHQFTGGPSYLMQFKAQKSSLDQDVAC